MYLDAGAWSVVVQVLVGVVVSIPILVGIYWGRIKTLLGRRRNNAKKAP